MTYVQLVVALSSTSPSKLSAFDPMIIPFGTTVNHSSSTSPAQSYSSRSSSVMTSNFSGSSIPRDFSSVPISSFADNQKKPQLESAPLFSNIYSTSSNCQKLPISSVRASGFETANPPSNTLDNNLSTRWSTLGKGSWIQLDLGSTKPVCSVDIAWYRGDIRQFFFYISSSTDGNLFTTLFSGKSSGTTTSLERYNLPSNTNARYIKITVNGNTLNDYASITEIAVNGDSGSAPGTGTLDKFGIKMLYSTKANGEQWFINMDSPTNDARFNPNGQTLIKNSDGSYKVKSTQVRLMAYTSSGYHPDQIATLDQKQMASKGYMQAPNDWKNVEITGYFRVNSFTSSTTNGAAHIELTARGGTHTSSKPCEGTAYHSNTYETGRSKFEKELQHTAGYATTNPEKPGATTELKGRWVGLKAVFYTRSDGTIKLEQWLDTATGSSTGNPGNSWTKLLEFIDTGNNWSANQGYCGGTASNVISWGGPLVFFRWDNIDDMDVKNFSAREILSPA